ncbi:MAG: flavin reductase family protein [Pleomorphochaeta sp.]
MADLKNMIISSMPHGKDILQEIDDKRKSGTNYQLEIGKVEAIVGKYHKNSLSLVVNKIIEHGKLARTIRLTSKDGVLPIFEAGQYLNIFTEIEGVRTSRPYSISSSPLQRAYYEITIARTKTGFVSDFLLDNVKVGDEFVANGPAGSFHHNPIFHSKKSVMIAGGSGITPFMSMSREIFDSRLDREVHLIYGCRNSESVLFKDELEALAKNYKNFTFSLVLSEPEEGFKGKTGFIDEACITSLVNDIKGSTFYICGPQIMNDFVVKALLSLDVRKAMIRREMFGSRQDIQNEPGWPSELSGKETFTITVDGDKKIPALSGESILTSLERAGVKMNVCCRSGECSLCRVQLTEGKVFLAKGMLLRYADEKFGYIHSCKAYPITDVSINL